MVEAAPGCEPLAPQAGSFTFERDDTSGKLTVTYDVSGGPTDLNPHGTIQSHTSSFPDGASTVTISIAPLPRANDATVSLTSGPYLLGQPHRVVVRVTEACACPVDLKAATERVKVGEAPTPVPIDPPDVVSLQSGELPPGLSINADGTWTGVADRPGTFRASLRVGAPAPGCADQLDLTIVVVSSELARTGVDSDLLVVVGSILVASGVVFVRRSASTPRPRRP